MIGPALARELEAVAAAPVLLVASDYDGVLSPIVNDPAKAVPDPGAFDAFLAAARLPATHGVIISGRALEALQLLTGSPQGIILVGTHGAEFDVVDPVEAPTAEVRRLAAELAEIASRCPGAEVEAKPAGAAFHYRNAPEWVRAADEVRAVGARHGARAIDGKMVIELLLRDENKGKAIGKLRSGLGADSVVYLGDDTTDEDVFTILSEADVGIRVGPEPTAADYRIGSQADVAEVFRVIAEARRAVSGLDA